LRGHLLTRRNEREMRKRRTVVEWKVPQTATNNNCGRTAAAMTNCASCCETTAMVVLREVLVA
jgi:hypothetical protein